MNGDADLYLKYGKDEYPTPEESHWSSSTISQEYIIYLFKSNLIAYIRPRSSNLLYFINNWYNKYYI